MKPIRTFSVIPSLPAPLERLRDLAYNLRWTWHHPTVELFRRLDSDLWEATGHNPIRMLGMIDQDQLQAAAADEGFLAHLESACRSLDAYLSDQSTWFRRTHGTTPAPLVAYFSAEYGLTECFRIFAGGLGVLAGDHLKSASDLGIPLVGIGLLYQQGYSQQYLNEAGWQQDTYENNDFHNLPLTLVRQSDGAPLLIEAPYPGRTVYAQVWRVQVGRIPLYMLDTNVPANSPEDRRITDQLYGGDPELRIKQEILLGIGGYRTLIALGLEPTVCHINEGHSAFLALEHMRRLMQTHKLSFAEAREAASAGLIFTTHTPVPAGHDYFSPQLMDHYLGEYARSLGLSRDEFLALGRQNPRDEYEPFCMTILALRLAAYSNGVSRLHGEVTRRMWQGIWPGVPTDEIPITHVTNGVHFRSWISHDMDLLYDRYLGPRWAEEPADRNVWQRVERIPAEELWRAHERRREQLVVFARQRLRRQLERRGASLDELAATAEVLDPEALTIGFSRRFATYKRATLILRDPARLARILNNPDRPVQIIFSGKAHPKDDPGKEMIRQIVSLAHQEVFRRRLVFLEDYDMDIARHLVQGADVWLNTPRRPHEASGTSGMKAAANGVLNLSTLDGWWDEAWHDLAKGAAPIGWTIGRGEIYDDPARQDAVEAEALYDLLEQEVIPTFYDRGADGLPRRWIARMKASIATLCHYFNTHRMVREYAERFYIPAHEAYCRLTADGMERSKRLAAWRARVQQHWPEVRIAAVETDHPNELPVGNEVCVRARVQLGALSPKDVAVELYLGRVDPTGELVDGEAVPMQPVGAAGDGAYLFEACAVPLRKSGLHGYTVRVLPNYPGLNTRFVPGLIVWAQDGIDGR